MKKIVLSLSLGLIMAGAELRAWRCHNLSSTDATVYFYGADGTLIKDAQQAPDGAWPCPSKPDGSWTGIGTSDNASYVGVKSGDIWISHNTFQGSQNDKLLLPAPRNDGRIDIMDETNAVVIAESDAGIIIAASPQLNAANLATWLIYNYNIDLKTREGSCDYLSNLLFSTHLMQFNVPYGFELLVSSWPAIKNTQVCGKSMILCPYGNDPIRQPLMVAKAVINAACYGVSLSKSRCGDSRDCKPTCKGVSVGSRPLPISCTNGVCDETDGWGYFFVDLAGKCL